MLIVIVIIGILAAALVPRLQDVQIRARDTKRKTDLRSIYTALEVYFADNGSYPSAGTGLYNNNQSKSSTAGQPRIPALSGIMTSIPVDPINQGGTTFNTGNNSYMYYGVFNTSVRTYDLLTQLENTTDPDICAFKRRKYLNNANYRCGSYSPMIYDLSPNVTNQ